MADGEIRVKATVDSDEWKELQKEIKKAENKLGSLKERQRKYDATGVKQSSAAYKNLAYDIQRADQRLSELIMEEKRFSSSISDIADASPWQRLQALARQTMSDMPMLFRKAIGAGLKGAVNVGKKSVVGLAKTIKNGAVSSVKKLGSTAKSVFTKLSSHTKKSNGLLSTFASRLKGISLSLLIFNWISKGFNAMVSGMKEGFQNLAKYSSDYNKSISELKSETAQLKNSMAAAFAPLAQTVLPILTQLVNRLNQSAEAMSRFIAMMSGKSTYTRATKQTEDYAKSLESAGKAADDAKGSLAGFDEITNVGNGSSGRNGTDASDMFEEVEVESISDFAQGMKNSIESGDWEGCGKFLAEKVNGMMRKVDFSTVQSKAQECISKFTGALNGFVSNFDWKTLGSTIGNGINTAIYSVNTFLNTTDWSGLGSGLASGINGVIQSLDASAIGNNLGSKIMAGVKFLSGFVTTLDWKGIGTSMYTMLNTTVDSIDWKMIAETLSNGVLGLLTTLKTFIIGTDWTEIGESFGTALANVDWLGILRGVWDIITGAVEGLWDILIGLFRGLGLDSVAGFLEGMKNKLKNIYKWIKTNMVDPLVTGVKKLLGIHSPSTVFSEIGKYIITGLLNGLKNTWTKITVFFNQAFANLRKFFSGNMLSNAWKKMWNGMVDTFKNIINVIPTTLENVINNAIDLLNSMINGANSIIGKIPGNAISSIPTISKVSIPKLAEGAVIPPNREFLAILGDQKHGTNIEAPLDTIVTASKQALAELLAELGINVTFSVEGDPNGLFRVTQKEAVKYTSRTGNPAFPV